MNPTTSITQGRVRLGHEPTLELRGRTYRMTRIAGVADRCLAHPSLDEEAALNQARGEALGAEAILYHLTSATGSKHSPMEYGGRFLEADRALLEACTVPTVLHVTGAGAYLDILAALPCTVIAWSQADVQAEPTSLGAHGLTCTDAVGADLALEQGS
ncbi:MAG: hypothetical protein IT207_12040 [Fimbriimonadaceae bacterium]|nr:hypothetical protein [Fimbriimonadaceae bacterium]